jgi:DNA gyrase/topoisomerase IV subunit B
MAEGEEYGFLNQKEHTERRAMWLGSKEQTDLPCWVSDGRGLERRPIRISEALLKCGDEIFVNACDQVVRAVLEGSATGGPVRNIDVTLDKESGEISVRNDGRGMGIYWSDKIRMWSVQGIATRTYSGSKFADDPDQVTGGINGLGMKLINICSESMTVETVDLSRGRFFRQTYHSREGEEEIDIGPPLVVDLESRRCVEPEGGLAGGKVKLSREERESHTTITFRPRYALLCSGRSAWKTPANMDNFEMAIRGRLCLLGAFLGSVDYRYVGGSYEKTHLEADDYAEWQLKMGIAEEGGSPKAPKAAASAATPASSAKSKKAKKTTRTVYRYEGGERVTYRPRPVLTFQGVRLPVAGINQLAEKVIPGRCVYVALQSEDNAVPYPWYLVFGLSPTDTRKQSGEFQQLTIVNGIYMEEGGRHVNAVVQKLLHALYEHAHAKADWLSKPTLENILKRMLYVVNIRQIPVPQMSSQSKTKLEISKEQLSHIRDTYMFSKEQVSAVWELVAPRFEDLRLTRELDEQRRNLSRMAVREPTHARRLLSKKLRHKMRLIVDEGDSAELTTKYILNCPGSPVSGDFTGTYNIQGVPPNALKQIEAVRGDVIKMSNMLVHNLALQSLRVALGLQYEQKYWYCGDHDPEALERGEVALSAEERALREQGDKEFAELPYGGGVIIATDQDHDGIGQICSLILVYFIAFWPELVKRRYLHRLKTPLIRLYAGKSRPVRSFYTQREFEAFVEAEYGGELPKRGVRVRYIKGLGQHSKEEVHNQLAPEFEELVVTFTWDQATRSTAEVLYGRDTLVRKQMLSTPISREYGPDYQNIRLASCSEHFEIEAKAYQLEVISRKLKSAIDGLIPSQRKALAGARRPEIRNEYEMRVYQVSGTISRSMAYHHGDASMNSLIIKMAQIFPGTNVVPTFMPISVGTGSRASGRSKNAGARYIDIAYNARAMDKLFPPQDDCLLTPQFAEGSEVEPLFYVPIVPYAILETATTTGTGWNIQVWARSRQRVWEMLRRMIEYGPEDPAGRPGPMAGDPHLLPGQVCLIRQGVEFVRGTFCCDLDADTVHITELPPKLWSEHLACAWLGVNPKTGAKTDKFGQPLKHKALVAKISDATSIDRVDMTVQFVPGGLRQLYADADALCEDAEDGEERLDSSIRGALDPVERYLNLYTILHRGLNMLSAEGAVREFASYGEVMAYWFPFRRALYEQRLEREGILLELRALLLRETLRFIELSRLKKVDIDWDVPEPLRRARLLAAGFWRFNTALLNNPGRTPIASLRGLISASPKEAITQEAITQEEITPQEETPGEEKAQEEEKDPQDATDASSPADDENGRAPSFQYIERVTTHMRSQASVKRMQRDLEWLQEKLEAHRALTWKKVWLEEIDALRRVIDEGERTGWMFDRQGYTYARSRGAAARAPKAPRAPRAKKGAARSKK